MYWNQCRDDQHGQVCASGFSWKGLRTNQFSPGDHCLHSAEGQDRFTKGKSPLTNL